MAARYQPFVPGSVKAILIQRKRKLLQLAGDVKGTPMHLDRSAEAADREPAWSRRAAFRTVSRSEDAARLS